MDKKIFIRRKEVLNHLPKEIRAGAKVKIGSIFVDRLPLKGVDGEEEAKLLKGIVDVPATHQDWPAKTKDFWASLSLKVPFEGVELNIGTHDDGTPVSPMDYIYWKWCMKHRQVAISEEEMNGNMDKVKMLTRVLMGTDPERLSAIELENNLYDYKEKNPERFLKYSLDDNLELRAEIETMVEKSVLRKIGNQLIYEDETIGEDIKDAIVYFKNKKNSGQVNIMRARLQEVI